MAIAIEKEVDEIVPLSIDYARALDSGDSVIEGNTVITLKDMVTDADVTNAMLVTGSKTLTSTVLSCLIQAGTLDHYYAATFDSGATTLGRRFTPEITVAVVIAPSPTNMLTTVAAIKAQLGIATSDTSMDDVIEAQIRHASHFIRRETGRVFAIRQHREELRPPEYQHELELRYTPVLAIDSVTVELVDGTEIESWTSADLDFDATGLVWKRDGTKWARWPHKNIVTYRDGQIPPDDIVGAAEIMTRLFYTMIGKEGMTSERIGDYVYRRASAKEMFGPGGIPDPEVARVIAAYQAGGVYGR